MTPLAPQTTAADPAALAAALADIVGPAHVRTAEAERVFFATDIFASGEPVAAVAAPADADELARVLAVCAAAGLAVVPRGGGFSYTQGYVPLEAGSVSIDMRRMDAIREINAEDLYVVVEAGCTWAKLYEALKKMGLRTPYFGPMSGFAATVGGALSQGSFFLGSTQYGSTAESVLSLEIALADGTLLRTGSAGGTNTRSPFFRAYGPDLTGLFLHDSGALGFKTAAVLRLLPMPAHHRYASFAFEADQRDAALAAMTGIARAGLAGECYLWDPGFAAKMAASNNLVDDMRYLSRVVSSGKGLFGGLRDGLRLARAGKRFLAAGRFLLHVTIDDVSDAGAQGKLDEVLRIGAASGGAAIEPSIPRALRAMPFKDFTQLMFADQRLRNVPTHGIFPHSGICAAGEAAADLFARHGDGLAAAGITIGTIFFAIGERAVCCEPLIYWADPQLALHDRRREASDVTALAAFTERPAAARQVAELRAELTALFQSLGAVHCQIGKSYPFLRTRQPETAALLHSIKDAVDPQHRMNPGALGFQPLDPRPVETVKTLDVRPGSRAPAPHKGAAPAPAASPPAAR